MFIQINDQDAIYVAGPTDLPLGVAADNGIPEGWRLTGDGWRSPSNIEVSALVRV